METNKSFDQEKSVISLRLEQYDDIFSDFDIRPYTEKALSIDFIDEIKRASIDKINGGIDLILHLPSGKRDESMEGIIKERLAKHFHRHKKLLSQEKRGVLGLGLGMFFLGGLCMVAMMLILPFSEDKNTLLSFVLLLLNPVSVFLLWKGMEQILFNSKKINPDLNFYKKMANSSSKIEFNSY